DGKNVLALVSNGDGGDRALWIRKTGKGGGWRQVSAFEDGVIDARFGRDGGVWLLSKKDAPRRKVLRLSADAPVLAQAKTVIAGLEGAIEHVEPAQDRVYVVEMAGGPTRVRAFDLEGKEQGRVPAPPISTNADPERLAGDDLFFVSVSYTQPAMGFRYDAKTGELHKTAVHDTAVSDFSDV